MAPAYFFLPPYTPELQPAEHLWEVIDEPIISKHIPDLETLETLDAIVSERCARWASDRQTLKRMTGFHGWPNIANAN